MHAFDARLETTLLSSLLDYKHKLDPVWNVLAKVMVLYAAVCSATWGLLSAVRQCLLAWLGLSILFITVAVAVTKKKEKKKGWPSGINV